MSKECITCGNIIPEGRLKALPKTLTCTDCSDVEPVCGHNVVSSKTEYSELQIVNKETQVNLNKIKKIFGQRPNK